MITWSVLQNSKLNEIIHNLPALAATIAKEMIKKVLMLSPLILKWWTLTVHLTLYTFWSLTSRSGLLFIKLEYTNSYYLYLPILKEVTEWMAVNCNFVCLNYYILWSQISCIIGCWRIYLALTSSTICYLDNVYYLCRLKTYVFLVYI